MTKLRRCLIIVNFNTRAEGQAFEDRHFKIKQARYGLYSNYADSNKMAVMIEVKLSDDEITFIKLSHDCRVIIIPDTVSGKPNTDFLVPFDIFVQRNYTW